MKKVYLMYESMMCFNLENVGCSSNLQMS